jgi:hypothetical protein
MKPGFGDDLPLIGGGAFLKRTVFKHYAHGFLVGLAHDGAKQLGRTCRAVRMGAGEPGGYRKAGFQSKCCLGEARGPAQKVASLGARTRRA